jgi:hypothetical protein
MWHIATKVKGEKLQSLHHPFDTQINEAMNNAVLQRCPMTRCLQDLEAFNIEWLWLLGNTLIEQHNMHTRDVYKQFGMQMSALQEYFWRQKESNEVMMEPTKRNSNERANEMK